MLTSHTQTVLTNRTGLPDDQLFLSKKHPRNSWDALLDASKTAKTWLGVHHFFRARSLDVHEQIEAIRNRNVDAELGQAKFRHGIEEVLSHLEMHHKIEDHHYFPKFQQIEPRLIKGFEIMDADHHVIHETIFDLSGKSRVFLQNASQSNSDRSELERVTNELGDALIRFRKNMLQHLDDEEDLVIPLIIDRNIV